MGLHVLRTPLDYARALLDYELLDESPVCFASSFLSSIYFSEKAIKRFYGSDNQELAGACDLLLKRRDAAIGHGNYICRKEIYEVTAFTKLLADGTVHMQDTSYRSHPSEISSALESMLEWIRVKGTLEVAVTTEVLPVVFALYPGNHLVIDIRTNYLYQRIQGFLIDNDNSTFLYFKNEFDRLWQQSIANIPVEEVANMIEMSLIQWKKGSSIDWSDWPAMRVRDND